MHCNYPRNYEAGGYFRWLNIKKAATGRFNNVYFVYTGA
jgi:hypothetical protein